MYSIRGNCRIPCQSVEQPDPTWTATDKSRALTVAARLHSKGVIADDIDSLVRCIIWKMKLPGLTYDAAIEERIATLMLGT